MAIVCRRRSLASRSSGKEKLKKDTETDREKVRVVRLRFAGTAQKGREIERKATFDCLVASRQKTASKDASH